MLDTKILNKEMCYIVGGSIRDILLDRTVKDIDYVVVGATPQQMLDSGKKQVGKDFPVFLDSNGDEYALARIERKVGNGYYGFETDYNPGVTLKEDLERRDLTCNSLAVHVDDWEEFQKTKDRTLVIDYFNGLQDLDEGMLRHVSDAFSDDPVRVLRIARFDARYDFNIDLDTFRLMARLVKDGELDHLTTERVYTEMEKAMMEDNPSIFFQVLDAVGACEVLFPELKTDDRLPVLVNESLERCVLLKRDFISRMIVLTAGMKTDDAISMFGRLKAPNDVSRTVKMSTTIIQKVLSLSFCNLDEGDMLTLLNDINAWKNTDTFQKVMDTLVIFDNDYLRNAAWNLLTVFKVANKACFAMLTTEQQETLKGAEIQHAIANIRVNLIRKVMDE